MRLAATIDKTTPNLRRFTGTKKHVSAGTTESLRCVVTDTKYAAEVPISQYFAPNMMRSTRPTPSTPQINVGAWRSPEALHKETQAPFNDHIVATKQRATYTSIEAPMSSTTTVHAVAKASSFPSSSLLDAWL